MTDRATTLVATLGLGPHPEGGYYGEVFRSQAIVHPLDARGSRAALTTIYFLLSAPSVSRWHRVLSDEVWHFYEGAPVELWTASSDGVRVERHELGPLEGRRRPVWAVAAGCWQAARTTGAYSLAGCTVGPGFEYSDFSLAADFPGIAGILREKAPNDLL
jgi:uncharacterized protein